MTNELIEFKDNFLVNFFEETRYNTSKKPGLLKNLFQNDLTVYARFKMSSMKKERTAIFAKQGCHSGAYFENQDGNMKFRCTIFTAEPDSGNYSDHFQMIEYYPKEEELFDEHYVIYQLDHTNKLLKTCFDGEWKEMKWEGEVCDYTNVPFWVGAGGPWYDDPSFHWMFEGYFYDFSIFNNVLSEDDCNLIIDNKESYLNNIELKDKCVTSLDFTKWNRFKVWDKTGNGNFGFIDEWHFINVQERLNELLAGNKLRTSTISNIKQTLI